MRGQQSDALPNDACTDWTTLFYPSFYGFGVIISDVMTLMCAHCVSQEGDVSLNNWPSIQIILQLWMEIVDIGF